MPFVWHIKGEKAFSIHKKSQARSKHNANSDEGLNSIYSYQFNSFIVPSEVLFFFDVSELHILRKNGNVIHLTLYMYVQEAVKERKQKGEEKRIFHEFRED